MKKLLAALIVPTLLASCSPAPVSDQTPVIAVSIAPLATMAKVLVGEAATIVTVIAPGESPATFDPSPHRMAALTGSRLYFACGVPMEHLLLPRLQDSHHELEIVDTTTGLTRIPIAEHGHDHGELDPHLWLDPQLMTAQVMVMAKHLATLLPDDSSAIKARADSLSTVLLNLDQQIRRELASIKGRDIFVFHPSFGYFARAYGLHQVAIEQGGLDPSPRHLGQVLDNIKAQGARAVFAQPQFSLGSARAVARETGVPMIVLDPLASDYVNNMLSMAHTIREALDDSH